MAIQIQRSQTLHQRRAWLDPDRASALAGWNVLALAVEARSDLDSAAAALDERGIDHGPILEASLGWILVVTGPDGLELRLYTRERHA